MSEQKEARFQGGEQVASVKDLVAEGGWVQPPLDDQVSQVKAHCQKIIQGLPLSIDARAHALTKLEEMCFWMRSKGEL